MPQRYRLETCLWLWFRPALKIVLMLGLGFGWQNQYARSREKSARLEVEGLDAWDGSPLLDSKPYLPQLDSHPQASMPKWAEGRPPE